MNKKLNPNCEMFLLESFEGEVVCDGKRFTCDKKWGKLLEYLRNNPEQLGFFENRFPQDVKERFYSINLFQDDINVVPPKRSPALPLCFNQSKLSSDFMGVMRILLEDEPQKPTGVVVLSDHFCNQEIRSAVSESQFKKEPCLIGWVCQKYGFLKYYHNNHASPCVDCLTGRFVSNIHLPVFPDRKLSLNDYKYISGSSLSALQRLSFVTHAAKIWCEQDEQNVWLYSFETDALDKVNVPSLPSCTACASCTTTINLSLTSR